MSTVLDTDREFADHLPHVMVVPASAGSGKTTELTRRLIQLLLSEAIPQSDFGNILAITFTNNAALDMKQRVLKTLKEVHFGRSDEEEALRTILPEHAGRIRAQAGLLVSRLLERYSEFHVQTIDSFLARVFKAGAIEFGFSPDFAITLSSDQLISEAFASVTRTVGGEPGMIPLFEELVDLALETGGAEGRFIWNPYEELSHQAKLLYGKLVQHAAPILVRDRSDELRVCAQELIACVLELDRQIEGSAVRPSAGFEKYAGEARRGNTERLLGLRVPDPPVVKAGAKPSDYARAVEDCGPLVERIRDLRSRLKGLNARQHFLPYARSLAALQQAIEEARRRRGEVDIGEVARRLARFLESDVVPELYFKLGEEVRHFLIDEFQDTSPVQWHVLHPLIANALSEGGSLFIVGDLKQSIYSFRGADWRIMHELVTSNPFPMAGPPDVRPLVTNYRSGERILAFNREVFQKIVPSVVESGAAEASGLATYRQDAAPKLRTKGYVETVFLARDDLAAPERDAIVRILEDCLRRGYQKRDIAILTPTNDAVIAVSSWLNEKSIEFISHSSLDIRSRKVTAEIVALLRFLDSPVEDLAFASFVLGELFAGALGQIRPGPSLEEVRGFIRTTLAASLPSRPLYALMREQYPELWKELFEDLFTRVGYLPLYDLVSEVCAAFRVFDVMPYEEAAVVKLLEVAQEFEEKGLTTVRDFVRYCDEQSDDADWTMALPADADAVQIMTVHKAKGLGFKVVIALLYDTKPRTESATFMEEDDGLTLVRLTRESEEVPELSEQYARKRQDEEVDRLNKLYVALTRAEEELYVISVKRDTAGQPSEFLPPEGYEQRERPVKVRPGRARAATPAALLHQNGRRHREEHPFKKISIAQTARGEFIHAVLEAITVLETDVPSQVRGAIGRAAARSRETLPTGLIGEAELSEGPLVAFLNHPEVRPLFEAKTGRRVLNEQEFSDASGRLLRMDRVIVDRESVTVVDFKTGDEADAYQDQVNDYMALLKHVFPGKTVRGALAYVDRLLVRHLAADASGKG